MASGTHYMLAEVDYLGLYGEDPGAIEMCYAIFGNTIEMDEAGNVVNFEHAQRRATDYLKKYLQPDFEVIPPFEDWELCLYPIPPKSYPK